MKKNYKASQIFNIILRSTLGIYIKIRFNPKANRDEIKDIKGPYILIGNHTNNWDPFIASIYIKEPVHFVAGEGNFKNPFLRWALIKLVGAIPKTKFMPDSSTIRHMIKVKNSNGIIGIFPEGQRNWHGVTGELMYSTAKLIKSLKLPVVTVSLKGMYLSQPRWAKKHRRGKVELYYHLALTPDKIKTMDQDEIFNLITEKLHHDEMEWQKNNNITFKGANAENLELFLFACPHCHSIETMESSGSEFKCTCCGYAVDYNEQGFIKRKSNILHVKSLYDWDKWQLELLHKKVDSLLEDEVLLEHCAATIYEGKKMKNFSSKFSGSLYLYKDRLILIGNDGKEKAFSIRHMDGVNVNLNRRIEFYYDKNMYRIAFNEKLVSAYMWVSAIEYIERTLKNTSEDTGVSSKRVEELV